MPIYDYQCRSCKHRFEQLIKPGEKPACPVCGVANSERFFPLSASVSTGRSRERALKGARGKARAEKTEKDHAHREYLQKHDKDHS